MESPNKLKVFVTNSDKSAFVVLNPEQLEVLVSAMRDRLAAMGEKLALEMLQAKGMVPSTQREGEQVEDLLNALLRVRKELEPIGKKGP